MTPDCVYWNFQLNNWWMESMDHQNHRVHVNKRTAVMRGDGTVCIIVSHTQPLELPADVNWIETAHHAHGTMAWRWVKSTEGRHPVPKCTVVPLAGLSDYL